MSAYVFGAGGWKAIPAIAFLATFRQWVCWRYESRGKDKPTKVPYQAIGKEGRMVRASSTDPASWATLDACYPLAIAKRFDGVGFVVTRDNPVVGIDLDGCLDSESKPSPEAAATVARFSSYTEISPSGTGLRIFIQAGEIKSWFTGRNDRNRGIEVYASGHYLTVTSAHLPGTPDVIFERGEVATAFIHETWPEPSIRVPGSAEEAPGEAYTIDPEAVPDLTKFMALIENNAKFKKSWSHQRMDLGGDDSGYDQSLALLAAHAGWSAAEIRTLVIYHRQQKCVNPAKGLRRDYLDSTVKLALDSIQNKTSEKDTVLLGRVEEEASGGVEEKLNVLSTRLGVDIQRVVQRGKDPANYYLVTEQGEIRLRGAGTLLSQARCRNTIMEVTGLFMPRMPGSIWDKLVTLMIQAADYEELAEGQRGPQTAGWIDAYLKGIPPVDLENPEAQKRAMIEQECSFVWQNKIYLRWRDFEKWLALDGQRNITDLGARMREVGWEPHKLSVRDGENIVKIRTWRKVGG